jgi:hypothetical protein
MLAYQAYVAQSCANTNIKPMQQESSLFSQYDPSCFFFLPHKCKTQKESEKKENEDM